jgi:hypothetical protein
MINFYLQWADFQYEFSTLDLYNIYLHKDVSSNYPYSNGLTL